MQSSANSEHRQGSHSIWGRIRNSEGYTKCKKTKYGHVFAEVSVQVRINLHTFNFFLLAAGGNLTHKYQSPDNLWEHDNKKVMKCAIVKMHEQLCTSVGDFYIVQKPVIFVNFLSKLSSLKSLANC